MDNQQQIDKQLAEMGENSGANANVKSITNIYYDCLERIFEFLDVNSLLNVANTCKRLQLAAAAYYGDVYGKQAVSLSNRFWLSIRIHDYNGLIDVDGLKCCLSFLRCFGPKILRLRVLYGDRANDDTDYFERYINQYCAKTLESIAFLRKPVFAITNFPNPFECVKEVHLQDVKLKEQLPHFVNLFPNLRRLDMQHVSVDGNCADVHFPNLEKLTIDFFHGRGFTKKNLVDLLHANPQLEKLKLNMRDDQVMMTVKELLNTISQNPSIKKLEVWNISLTNVNSTDLMRFASERPLTVMLDLMGPKIPPQDAINFIRQLKSLKKFRFLFSGYSTDYDQLVSQLDSEWNHKRGNCLSGNAKLVGHEITLRR